MRIGMVLRDNHPRLVILIDNRVFDLAETVNEFESILEIDSIKSAVDWPKMTLDDLVKDTERFDLVNQVVVPLLSDRLEQNPNGERFGEVLDPDNAVFLPPICNPGKIVCVGLNYPDYRNPPELQKPEFPVLFLKPKNTLIGHKGKIHPPTAARNVFCEGELAVVIGRKTHNIPASAAQDIAAGFTIANDTGAADLEARTSQWTSGKMADGFTPMGPALVTPDEFLRSKKKLIQVRLNRQLILSGQMDEMFFPVNDLLAYISTVTTLYPGDLVLTGSPKAVDRQPIERQYLDHGDQVEVFIQGLGRLVNTIVRKEIA